MADASRTAELYGRGIDLSYTYSSQQIDAMTEDFYDLLDVPSDASQEEIKAAFRDQVRIYHPDLNDDERAQAQFTALKTAYDVLGDPVERRAYDRLGHTDYVAKRTSGLPSPEKWLSEEGPDTTQPPGESSVETETDSWGATRSSARSSTRQAGTATARGSTAAGGTRDGSGVRSSTSTRSASGTGSTGALADVRRRFARWWRSLNVAGPLLWFATSLYILGLVQYSLANTGAVSSLWAGLRAAGGSGDSVWTALTTGTHGLPTGFSHVSATQPVTPPLAGPLWYAALGALVVLVIGLLLGWRVRSRGRLRGPVTIDETIVIALALGSTSALVGGVLLAGALLLPLLFAVVIYHSRRIPGWSPSYLYLFAVTAPVCGLLAGAVDATSVPLELLAFVVVPLLGALGLPLRFLVRRRFGI